jgi:hypothetical protein
MMEEEQRSAMFDAWAGSKKSVEVEVKQLEDGSWMATPKSDFGCVVYRDTKPDVISAIHDTLTRKGCRISNLAEIQGIV